MGTKNEDDGFQWLEVDLSDVVFLIRKNFRVLIFAPVIGFALAFAVAKVMRPVFSTTAEIYLRPNFDKEMQLERTYSKLDDSDSLRSIERSMISDTVILAMVDRLGLREDIDFLGEEIPPDELTDAKVLDIIRDRYTTRLVPTTRLVDLTVEDYSANRTTLIAETLIGEFLIHLRNDRNSKELELRETLITQAGKALQEALVLEEKLKEFRSENPDTLVEQDSSIFHDRLIQIGKELNEANSEKSKLAGILAALESIDAEKDPYRVFQLLNNRNSDYLSELLTMQATAKASIAVVKDRVTERHPDFLAAVSRLEDIERSLRTHAAEMKSGVDSQYSAATQKVTKLNEDLSALRGDFVGFKSTSAEFRGLKDEIDRSWNTHTKLQGKIMELDLHPEVTPTFVTVMSAPVVPDKKSGPRTLFWVAGGMFFGGIFALGKIYWRHRKGLPFTSKEQLTKLLKVPMIAELEMPKDGNVIEQMLTLEQSPQILNLLISLRNSQLVHVTSLGDESKYGHLSWVLGRMCSNRGSKTLVISFGYRTSCSASILPTETPNLSALNLSADLLLNLNAFREGLKKLTGDFDRVFIDTTQLSETEAMFAVSVVSGVTVLTVNAECEQRAVYEQYVQQCRASGSSSISVVYLSETDLSDTGRKGEPERIESSPRRRLTEQPANLPV